MAKSRRKFPDSFYEIGRNKFGLDEYWYTQYVIAHPSEFGLSSVEGPFYTGPDLTGILDGKTVTIEVEKEYLTYLQHGHPRYDVLIVGVLDLPDSVMSNRLPRVIMNLDPQKVLDWSAPMRARHQENLVERGSYVPEERCQCGEWAARVMYDPEKDGPLSEGQEADMMAGHWAVMECKACGQRGWIEGQFPSAI